MTHVSNEQMAEALGAKYDQPSRLYYIPLKRGCRNYYINGIPNFTHDLNLVHEIEETLDDSERERYVNNLYKLMAGVSRITSKTWYLLSATEQQKCDALYPILQERSKG
jgi:hypothetical protein